MQYRANYPDALRIVAISIAILLTCTLAVSQTEEVLHAFHLSDGAFPQGVLIADSHHVYGTTPGGGLGNCVWNGFPGCGTVFALSRRGGGWIETVLHSFQGSDGAFPMAGLVADGAGNLYGTTSQGGLGGCSGYGCGAVFELSPPVAPEGNWTYTLLYSFTGKSDGAQPQGTLIFDKLGNLYGTTSQGAKKAGTVFELSPPAGGGAWTETTLHQFDPSLGDGGNPMAALVFDGAGNLYGTTTQGGVGLGTVFQLKPPKSGGNWTERLIYAFKGNDPDGQHPSSTLVMYRGSLVGTTSIGGQHGQGTVFQLTPLFGEALETILYNFQYTNETPFANPNGTLAVDVASNLYASSQGGIGFGAVIQLSPPASPGDPWTAQLLYSFTGGNDGAYPTGGILLKDGHLLGTTSQGGGSPLCSFSVDGCGTVFTVGK
jgi:hypothetical protein